MQTNCPPAQIKGQTNMARKTSYIVYVEKDIMEKPSELCDAVMSHFIKKELDIQQRRQFLIEFMKVHESKQLDVINSWVMVRDVATFPFRKDEPKGDGIED